MSNETETVELTFDEEIGYHACHVPSDVASQGETREEALRALAEALELHYRPESEAQDASDEWFEKYGVSQ